MLLPQTGQARTQFMLEYNNYDDDPYGKEIPQKPIKDFKSQDLGD
jgi:hypothetical protein